MKKILALLCGLAFASGAWAYSYDFAMTIDCPTSFTQMSAEGEYFLLNTETHQCYLYWRGSDWAKVTKYDGRIILNEDVSQSGTVTYQNETYNIISGTFEAAGSKVENEINGDSKIVKFEHQLKTDVKITAEEIGVSGTAPAPNLLLVINDPVVQKQYALTWGEIQANIYDSGSYVGMLSQATGSGVMTVVPEPTSGLLLLLGVAGLALRRRKVA